MNKYSLMFGILVIMICVSVFGGYANYHVELDLSHPKVGADGEVEVDYDVGEGNYSIVSGTIGFITDAMTFKVESVPLIISVAFYIMQIMLLWLLLNWVRGNG